MPALKNPDQTNKMTVSEFLPWSETQEGKWELHDGVPVRLHDPAKMQSERARHARTKNNMVRALEQAVNASGQLCEAMPDGMTVVIDEEKSYKPDALVYCGAPIDGDSLVVPNPVIIVEVLSPSTAYKDVSTKLLDYFKLPSVMHYLILDPNTKQIQHHFRKDGLIRTNVLYETNVQLNPPNLTVALDTLWG